MTVGRLQCNISIVEKSVSRIHAMIYTDSSSGGLWLADISRFGTYVDNSRIPQYKGEKDTATLDLNPQTISSAGGWYAVHDGQVIRFGTGDQIFQAAQGPSIVVYVPSQTGIRDTIPFISGLCYL